MVTLKSVPPQELVAKLEAALKELDALEKLGSSGSPAAILSAVPAVKEPIQTALGGQRAAHEAGDLDASSANRAFSSSAANGSLGHHHQPARVCGH